jgi:hypothetical protein
MADITTLPDHRRDTRLRLALVAVLVVAFIAAMAAEAGATVRFEHHTNPAGEPTLFTYNLLRADESVKNTTQLDARDWNTSFGPVPGRYILQAAPPAGWRVVAIRCTTTTDADPTETQAGIVGVDVTNARVTIDHVAGLHQVCAFTNARVGASGTASAGGSGVAPTPVTGVAGANAASPGRTVVSRVIGGRRSATAVVRLARSAVMRATLLNGRRVVGTRRLVRPAGEHQLKVNIPRKELRRLRAGGRTRATLRMRVVLAEQGGATRVFTIGVRVRL